jgi:cytoskeletal protein CcmA (bactofilin family)
MAIFGRKREDGPTGLATDSTAPVVPTARDGELGVPPYRPASKDAANMSLGTKPMSASNSPNAQPGGLAAPPRPAGVGVPARPAAPERRTLVVGRGISLQGTVSDAERLVVEGTVESAMIQATELFVAHSGVFKGEVQVEDAEIAGHFDGTITARNSLVVRGTGKVTGTARCKKLSVEEGGQLSGKMEMLSEGQTIAPPSLPPRPLMPVPAPTPSEV